MSDLGTFYYCDEETNRVFYCLRPVILVGGFVFLFAGKEPGCLTRTITTSNEEVPATAVAD